MNDWQHFNRQLKELSGATLIKVPVFGSLKLNQAELASGLARDLRSLLRYVQLEWPSIIAELNAPV
ncbi:MAG: hypothetical protein PHQ86_08675, partial [Dehalococcoidales bacterium]|nr:hypothetical protein [Dehalococcoidales bacterium]